MKRYYLDDAGRVMEAYDEFNLGAKFTDDEGTEWRETTVMGLLLRWLWFVLIIRPYYRVAAWVAYRRRK